MARRLWIVGLLLYAPALCRAQAQSLSGVWKLNVEKSSWGVAGKPVSIMIVIEHREPMLRYQGNVIYPNDETREFSFEGAMDGNPYPNTRSYGAGVITIKRINATTIESVFRTEDGSYVETARTKLSANGRWLTRMLTVKTPTGPQSWTEVYERR